MYRYSFLPWLLLLSLSLFAQTPKVLVIGIDGCRPDVLESANTPNIDALIANGYFSPDALNDDITISGPGWSAILCGVRSDKHGVTNNGFGGSNYTDYPDFLKRIKDFDPNLYTASIVHWNPINDQIVDNIADRKINVATDQAVEDEAVTLLSNFDPDAVFLHFDDPDGAGHAAGFAAANANYITQIEEVDAHIGKIMTALTDRPNYEDEDWLIILAPDHGGLGTSHGGNSIEEQRVFFIVSGDNVPMTTVERTETVTPPPTDCLGADFELNFDGDNDRVSIPETNDFNFGANQDFTVECRVRATVSADVAIVGDKDWDSGLLPGFVLSFRFPSGPEWKINLGDGSNRADLNVDAIADGEWHTLSATFDRDGQLRAYTDGVFVGATDISGIGNINTSSGLFFGADVNNAYDYNGSLSEVRIWNGIRSAQEIADWACLRLDNTHPSYADILGYWPLDENAGNTAFDESGNGNNGNITGAVWQMPQPMITFDYSNTPRLEDVAVTALEHLCIPILPQWNLDGQPRGVSCAILPVDWLSVSAEWQADQMVVINWQTAGEQDNAGYRVEKLTADGEWNEISELILPSPAGRYHFLDQHPSRWEAETYRIRQLDLDGTSSYSRMVIAVMLDHPQTQLDLSPIPANGNVRVRTSALFKAQDRWRLYNAAGHLVGSGQTGTNHYFEIDVTKLSTGTYYLEISGYEGKSLLVH